MFATCIGMKIASFRPVEHVQSISCVAGRVTVDKIEIHRQTITVCNIHHLLQLLRCSISAVYQQRQFHFRMQYKVRVKQWCRFYFYDNPGKCRPIWIQKRTVKDQKLNLPPFLKSADIQNHCTALQKSYSYQSGGYLLLMLSFCSKCPL